MKTKVKAQGGELVLRNEHGDTIIVPREKRKEAMKALLKDDHRAIDSLALQLPKASRYAAGGTVIKDRDPGDPTLLKPQPYRPSNTVLDAKGALAGLSLAGNAFGPTIGYGAQLLNVGGDLYTGTRYAMDGQYKNAAIDYGQALIGMIPSSRMVTPKKMPNVINLQKARVVDNKYANYLNTALDLLDLFNVPNNYDMKKQNKTKTKK